jgi:SAM-dependent methyltransferase
MTVPDFSPLAREYARSRPTYPPALFDDLASRLDRRRLAWDCATGNGQAAVGLTRHFERVIATDISPEQIRYAAPHPRIEYRVATAEQSGLEDGSVDLLTVAAAVHWFDPQRFEGEVRRVVRRGGVLAAWTYHVGRVEPPFDGVFARFYRDVLAPYFAAGARSVDDLYETLSLPGEPLDTPSFVMSADWDLDRMRGFIASWSGTRRYLEERREDPAERIGPELERLWGPSETVRTVRWPLFLRVSRL